MPNFEAYAQLDVTEPCKGTAQCLRSGCYFPQSEDIEQLITENRNATFIIATRSFDKWFSSMQRWQNMDHAVARCHVPNLGLPLEVRGRPGSNI